MSASKFQSEARTKVSVDCGGGLMFKSWNMYHWCTLTFRSSTCITGQFWISNTEHLKFRLRLKATHTNAVELLIVLWILSHICTHVFHTLIHWYDPNWTISDRLYICIFMQSHIKTCLPPPTPQKSPVSDVFQNLLVGKLDKLVANDHFSHLRNGT